jgi:predicted dehydrogenase
MLEIGMGHQLDIVTHLLGEFSSVSATTAIAYPTVTLVDASGKPTGNTVTSTVSDHIAFSGELKSGAVASVTWRSGYSLSKGRKQLLWIIDGDDGSITMEDDDSTSE